MAIERKLISFSGGMQSVPSNKPLNSPDEIINYEQLEKGILQKRRDPIVFETSFDSMVRQTFNVGGTGNIIDYAPEPFYPANLPSDISDGYDYLIPVYGNTGGTTYKLYLFYKTSRGGPDAWDFQTAVGVDLLQGLVDDGVVFTANSKLRFSYDKNLLYVADDVNNLFFITTDDDGNVVSGKCGIPASKSRPIITAMDGWESQYFEEDDIGNSLGDIGFVRVVYNCATKEGHKNNPSPASEFVDFQYIKLDAGSQDRWLKKFQVTNAKVPDSINDYIKGELKYFDFSFQILRYSEGLDAEIFGFSCRKEIFNKDGANSYTIVIPASDTIPASWENDVAPVAKDLVAFDGKVVLAQVKDKLKFPFEFDHIWKIKLNNQDNITAVNGVVRIRLYDNQHPTCSENEKITDLNDWADFDAGENDIIDNLDKLRIYDSDLTTPIPVIYILDTSENYCDIYLSVPQLEASGVHTLYFCFDGDGINGNATYQTATYGKWIHLDDWDDQKVFSPIKVVNENCLVCSPTDEKDWSNYYNISTVLPNKANTNIYGDLTAGLANATWETGAWVKAIIFNSTRYMIGENQCIQTGATKEINYDLAGETCPDKLYVYMFIKKTQLTGDRTIFSIGSAGQYFGIEIQNLDNHLRIILADGDAETQHDTGLSVVDDVSLHGYFLFVSINFADLKARVFTKRTDELAGTGDTAFSAEIDLSSDGKPTFGANPAFRIGHGAEIYKFADIHYNTQNYIDDENTIQNIANFMPAFDNMVGYKYSNTSHNNNITFEQIDNSLKTKNILRFSKKGGFAFPDTYYKAGIPSPIVRIVLSLSTLALQSQNVIKVYLRNGLYKFIASGDPSTWSNLSNNLIRQSPRRGLLQQDALTVTPFGDYHLSEAGIVEWLGDNIRIVTNQKTEDDEYKIIDISLDKAYVMFFVPLRQQLWIQEK